MADGQIVTPMVFEKTTGRTMAKKWRFSLKVKDAAGNLHMTLGDWLIAVGLEEGKARPLPEVLRLEHFGPDGLKEVKEEAPAPAAGPAAGPAEPMQVDEHVHARVHKVGVIS